MDLTFKAQNVFGWPKFHFSVYGLDSFGADVIRGYGFTHLPSTPGQCGFILPMSWCLCLRSHVAVCSRLLTSRTRTLTGTRSRCTCSSPRTKPASERSSRGCSGSRPNSSSPSLFANPRAGKVLLLMSRMLQAAGLCNRAADVLPTACSRMWPCAVPDSCVRWSTECYTGALGQKTSSFGRLTHSSSSYTLETLSTLPPQSQQGPGKGDWNSG